MVGEIIVAIRATEFSERKRLEQSCWVLVMKGFLSLRTDRKDAGSVPQTHVFRTQGQSSHRVLESKVCGLAPMEVSGTKKNAISSVVGRLPLD